MDFKNLLEKPLIQLTTQEFLFVQKNDIDSSLPVNNSEYSGKPSSNSTITPKTYVYGIKGIMNTFDCSESTAKRIKKNKLFKPAIVQFGRKIITDVDLVLKLAANNQGGRK